jgi:hypothetical protein
MKRILLFLIIIAGVSAVVPQISSVTQTHNRDSISFFWVNPVENWTNTEASIYDRDTTLLLNSTNTTNNNITFSGLLNGKRYKIGFWTFNYTINSSYELVYYLSTNSNNLAVVTPIFPSSTPYNLSENSSYVFEVNVSDSEGDSLFIEWFKNAVSVFTETIVSAGSSVWTWVTGYEDSGSYNVSVVVNDSFNVSSTSWNVTVLDTFPVPFVPSFGVSSGSFEYSIPLSCVPSGSVVSPFVFEFFYGVNASSVNSSLGFNSSSGLYAFDISNYAYGSNFSFSCRVVSITGSSDLVYSGVFTKINKNNFYLFSPDDTAAVTANTPYLLGMVAEIDNSIGATLYANVVDCNGDGVFDYSYKYAGLGLTSARKTFTCVNNAGKKKTTIGMIIYKNNTYSWNSIGCKNMREESNYCIVYKTYEVNVI